jgi:hypothetical protein
MKEKTLATIITILLATIITILVYTFAIVGFVRFITWAI